MLSEFLSFEICNYFCMRTRRIDQIAAYATYCNFASIFYSIGIGFSIVSSVRINSLIGKRMPVQAKNLYNFLFFVNFTAGYVLAVVLYMFKTEIARFYSPDAQTAEIAEKLISIYLFLLGPEVTLALVSSVMRSIGRETLLTVLCVFLYFGINTSLGFYFCFELELYAFGLVAAFIIGACLVIIICKCVILCTDWSTIKIDDYSNDEKSEEDTVDEEEEFKTNKESLVV